MPQLTLGRQKITTYLACRRRFRLRYLDELPWPEAPPDAEAEDLLARGQRFHQLLERHFLGLAVDESLLEPRLRQWWRLFRREGPTIKGRFLPEVSITVPVGEHLLNGRFDLVVIGEDDTDRPTLHIYDWKTGRPQPEATLRQAWQTRLYLALAAEGSAALVGHAVALAPAAISLTYWYIREPEQPRTIHYDAEWHAHNWAEIQEQAGEIAASLAQGNWPKTDTLEECRICAYQAYCGRQEAGQGAMPVNVDGEVEPLVQDALEPDAP